MDNYNDEFYEIEYDACPLPGVGKFVRKSQKVEQPQRDEIRELFYQMRDIAHNYRTMYSSGNRFYDKRVQKENAWIFYKQGIFMKDFEDQFAKTVDYSSYFPNYQMMGYEQLRTYFSWRTKVRQGNVEATSLSYAFLYIYELLHNIGVADAQEGLDRLLFFWQAYRAFDQSLDKYVLRWLKDYHVYYDLQQSFKEFVRDNQLEAHYPELDEADNYFATFGAISKYDIRKSAFYTEDRAQMIQSCFEYTIGRLERVFEEYGIHFEESVFRPTKSMAMWDPFKGALFYHWKRQPDRKVVLSRKEVYVCSNNNWTCSAAVTTESGKKLIGYVMKQMEAVLRQVTKYKYKITADSDTVSHEAVKILRAKGVSLETVVTDAVREFYREVTKTVVKVDPGALSRIREEALITQEKLTVEEEDEWLLGALVPSSDMQESSVPHQNAETATELNPWTHLKNALSEIETQALSILLNGTSDIKQFADEHSIMLEVLIDGINEKAMDYVGDSLLDEEYNIYDDYAEQVREMVEEK